MQITKTQSRLLAIGSLLIFFAAGSLFLNSSNESSHLALSTQKEMSQTEAVVNDPKASLTEQVEQAPEVELANFQRSEIKDGKKVWEINAARSIFNTKQQTTTVFDAILHIYRNPEKVIVLKAEQATIILKAGKPSTVNFVNHVDVTIGNEMRLVTNQATYNAEEDSIYSPSVVKVEGAFYYIEGAEFHANLEREQFEFRNHNISVLNKGAAHE